MSNQLDITQFNKTKVVKKLSKSKSNENIKDISEPEPTVDDAVDTALKIMEATTKKRGRKSKYNNDEERKQARRQQQKEYRERKKKELEDLKKMVSTQQ